MAIAGVFEVKELYFLGNLPEIDKNLFVCLFFRAYLQWRQGGTPFMHEFCEGAVWTTLLYLAKTAKYGQLVVCHTHVSLILVVN